MREVLTNALYNATALGTCSRGTISVTNDRRNGLSKASATPPTTAVANNAASGGWCMNARAASATDWAISIDWVMNSRFRLLDLSAIAPPQTDRNRIGPNWQAASHPTATPLLVRCNTSSVRATMVSQLPVFDTNWPKKNSLKLRVRIDENVRRAVPRTPPTGPRSGSSPTGMTSVAIRRSDHSGQLGALDDIGLPRERPLGQDHLHDGGLEVHHEQLSLIHI